ncbi:MAG TPA: Fe-S cluster assembly protein SufD [Caulobacteraceae bacterium]|nr:Fe-S cluster assembly protein SufD [Caulobacteraceae bacterium]
MSVARAIETGDVALLPSRREEDWRWSDLRGLIRVAPPASPANEGTLGAGPFASVAGEEIAIVNGRGPGRLTVAAGERRTVALRFVAAPNAGAHVARLAIEIGEGADLTLLESYEGEGADYLADAELTIALAPRARLERIVRAQDSDSGVSVSRAEIALGAGSVLAQTVLTSGARRQRLETRVSHPGAGAAVRLDGLYLLGDRRHGDITTIVTHEGVDGVTDQLTKGVVDGQARGVFQGRIVVSPGADRTDARMGHHALILSDRAEVDGKPELEIYADEVACAHGNTVGALDEEALFYARQRGLPETVARAMLTGAFLGEVIDRIAHEGARDAARTWLAERLEAST